MPSSLLRADQDLLATPPWRPPALDLEVPEGFDPNHPLWNRAREMFAEADVDKVTARHSCSSTGGRNSAGDR